MKNKIKVIYVILFASFTLTSCNNFFNKEDNISSFKEENLYHFKSNGGEICVDTEGCDEIKKDDVTYFDICVKNRFLEMKSEEGNEEFILKLNEKLHLDTALIYKFGAKSKESHEYWDVNFIINENKENYGEIQFLAEYWLKISYNLQIK